MKRKNTGIIIIFILIAVGVVGLYYYFLTNQSDQDEDLTGKKTPVQELIDMDLDIYYPATVKTVMEAYGKFCVAFYNEDYSDEEYTQLLRQYRKLMDDELLANNPEDAQILLMKEDVDSFKDDKKTLFNYRFIDDPKNKESIIDGKYYATITMSFGIKAGASRVETTEEDFILRKDKDNRWKILGWKLRDKADSSQQPSPSPSATPKTEK